MVRHGNGIVDGLRYFLCSRHVADQDGSETVGVHDQMVAAPRGVVDSHQGNGVQAGGQPRGTQQYTAGGHHKPRAAGAHERKHETQEAQHHPRHHQHVATLDAQGQSGLHAKFVVGGNAIKVPNDHPPQPCDQQQLQGGKQHSAHCRRHVDQDVFTWREFGVGHVIATSGVSHRLRQERAQIPAYRRPPIGHRRQHRGRCPTTLRRRGAGLSRQRQCWSTRHDSRP